MAALPLELEKAVKACSTGKQVLSCGVLLPLDPENVAMIEAIVREQRDAGKTVAIVTHNLFQARRLANDAALLIDGALAEAGPVELSI